MRTERGAGTQAVGCGRAPWGEAGRVQGWRAGPGAAGMVPGGAGLPAALCHPNLLGKPICLGAASLDSLLWTPTP